MWAKQATVIPDNYTGFVIVKSDECNKNVLVKGGVRGKEEGMPRYFLRLVEEGESMLPITNVTGEDVVVHANQKLTLLECYQTICQIKSKIMMLNVY